MGVEMLAHPQASHAHPECPSPSKSWDDIDSP